MKLDLALKEWAVVCDLLIEGNLALLLRKGGIHEEAGPGRFKLEHEQFGLFPAWEHQKPDWIKPAYRDRAVLFESEPASFTLRGMARVDHIWPVPSRAAFDQLDDLHCWERPQVDMRFNYKPERPLYLMAVRAYELAKPQTITMTADYAGCKSWVPLHEQDHFDAAEATPALSDDAFAAIVQRLHQAMSA